MAALGAENGLWDWDLATSRLHYSPAWVAMLGCADGDCGATSEEWFKRVHPEDLERVRREIAARLEDGSAGFELQHRMLHGDGCYRWMSCEGAIVRDAAGKAVRITGFHADITPDVGVDALTGLPNRHVLLNRLARSIEKARDSESFHYAVLVVDLDLFESGVNRLETLSGDTLVVAAARRLESALRTKDSFGREGRADLVARSGGEEFVVLLEGLSGPGEAGRVAARLLTALLAPFAFNGRDTMLSPSIGIALSATGYRRPEDALRDADAALHRARSLGKSRCEIFDTAVVESAQKRRHLEKELRGALGRNEFLVFYQPIVSLESNRVEGLEALVRWKHPSRGILPPADFIPTAERTGLIADISRWVLEQACRRLKNWHRNPAAGDLWVSVNLSGAQFSNPSLAKDMRDVLLETGLDARNLVLELTEGMAMENPEAARSLLMQMRVMGAKIAIDDFGTGYSSLAHLRRFPLDYLKIDHSFVKSIEKKPDAREILRTIRTLAHQLGLRVIVEGIESSGQLELVRSMGCEYAQGFLFSKPVGGEQVGPYLQEGFAFDCEGRPARDDAQAGEVEAGSSGPEAQSPGLRWKPWRNPIACLRRHRALALATAAVLLLMGNMVLHTDGDTPGPAADPPALVATAPAEKAPRAIVPPAPAATPPAAKADAGAPEAETPPAKARPVPAAAYGVEHSHRIGSCKGTLKITPEAISYAAENGKDDFTFKHTQCSYSLEGARLAVRTASRTYRFRSLGAKGEENLNNLNRIMKQLSRYRTMPPPKTR